MEAQLQPVVSHHDHMSAAINELAAALSKAQSAMSAAVKDGTNPFFNNSRYASLASIWDAIRKPLADNGLAISQLTGGRNTGVEITTMLLHSSGQWLRSAIVIQPVKADPQGIGSAITYGRRYALSAIVGAVADEDDDGNEASNSATPRKAPAPQNSPRSPQARPAPAPRQAPAINGNSVPEVSSEAPRPAPRKPAMPPEHQVTFDRIAELLMTKCGSGENRGKTMEDVLEMMSEKRVDGVVTTPGVRAIGKLNFVPRSDKHQSQATFIMTQLDKISEDALRAALTEWRDMK